MLLRVLLLLGMLFLRPTRVLALHVLFARHVLVLHPLTALFLLAARIVARLAALRLGPIRIVHRVVSRAGLFVHLTSLRFARAPLAFAVVALLLEGVDLPFGFILLDAVPLLNRAGELVATTMNLTQIVVSELAPLLLDLALKLLPISLHSVPVHRFSP